MYVERWHVERWSKDVAYARNTESGYNEELGSRLQNWKCFDVPVSKRSPLLVTLKAGVIYFTPSVRLFIPETVFYTQSVVRSPCFILTENQTWPPHFAREEIESIVFIFGSLWTQQDGSGTKVKYSWLRLPSPSVFPVYQVIGTCSSGMCKFEALIFLESCRVSWLSNGKLIFLVTALTSLV